jgi:CRISP-associated protein Cas1
LLCVPFFYGRGGIVTGALPAGAAELGRLSDRLSFIYVEHARVDRGDNAVTVLRAEGTAHIPVAMLGALLLGPGTRITHAAVALLAGSGCSVVWTGEEGVRLYAGAVAASTGAVLLQRQAQLVSVPASRVAVARRMYAMRFPGEDVSGLSMEQLRGREGARVRACYREQAVKTGVRWSGRQYNPGDWGASDLVNRMLSAANAALYGVCHAAILHLGGCPGLGFVHTGHQLSFVYDLADLYKAEITIPAAFSVASVGGGDLSGRVRRAVRDQIVEAKLLGRIATDLKALLGMPADDPDPGGMTPAPLWDGDSGGLMPGGHGYQEQP